MKIKITHKNTEISDEMRNFIERKCDKLQKFVRIVGEVDVVMKMEKNYRCFSEINLLIRGTVIHGEAEAGELLSSFEEALSKVEKQVKKHRDRIKEHNNHDYDNNRTF